MFQSTPLQEGRLNANANTYTNKKFQSTPLQEGRLFRNNMIVFKTLCQCFCESYFVSVSFLTVQLRKIFNLLIITKCE